MDFYYCEICGAVFMEDDMTILRHEEPHGELDGCPSEILYERLCPECGSASIEECEYCDWCGEPFKPEDLVDGMCEKCRKELEDDE